MTNYVDRAGLAVAANLADFIEQQALPQSGVDAAAFWRGAADIFADFVGENAELLDERNHLQSEIDKWLGKRVGLPIEAVEQEAMLREIGYLTPEPAPFQIDVSGVDAEIATVCGPQLVVPALNKRFLLNAANARWGSLYDALYGSDAIPGAPAGSGYDPTRGAKVIAAAKGFLDDATPLAAKSHATVERYRVVDGRLDPALANAAQFVGYRGAPAAPSAILLRHNGLHIELMIDRAHAIGADDLAGVADIIVEAALTSIVDLEDSVSAVDAEDKVDAYANWLGLMRGNMEARFEKAGRTLTRRFETDRCYTAPDGGALTLPGRSLLLVRNVGLHMMTPAVRLADGADAPEGILDAIVTSLIGLHDLRRNGRFINSRAGSIYIVKPKLHGPKEAAFCDRLFAAVEQLLGLERYTIKLGLMDEERRTSANLAACIEALRHRIMFINTGFLDRTGDEIHTAMAAGPVRRKGEMKTAPWLQAYEKRNVGIGLACGFSGKGQIGKGMWAIPNHMSEMLAQKIAHPRAGANTAWVPSPTAATLHALHYHEVDVLALHKTLARQPIPPLSALLSLPLAKRADWSQAAIQTEIDNNVQSILGYVVRWVDQGVGCSTIPDINDVGLMEDRATLRISSQLLANWIRHGVCTIADIDAALIRLADRIDAQNAADPAYMKINRDSSSLAVQAARALIVDGAAQANGYTEGPLHKFRRLRKA